MKSKIFRIKSFCSIILFNILSTAAFADADLVDGNLIQFNDNGAWCWYQDERAVIDTIEEKMIIGSVGSQNGVGGPPRNGLIEAVIFDIHRRLVLQRNTLMNTYCDDHNMPAFLVRPDGKYTAFYALHGSNTISYYRIFDTGTWGLQQQFNWNAERPGGVNYNTTYSNLFYLSGEARMYNFARGHGYGAPNFMYSDDGGDNWAYGGQLSRGTVGGYTRGYYKYWGNGVDRIDFIATETHPRNYNTSIYHAYIQNGNVYNSFDVEVDTSIYDTSFIPTTANFTTVFAANTILNGEAMTHCWNDDIMRYQDGTIAAIISARTGGSSSDPDHAFIYCRFDDSIWTSTYLVNAGKKMYVSEEDYVGLGALHPNDPNTIYISTPYDPRDNLTFLGVREIFKGVTSDSGATWNWTPITFKSVRDNFRPIIPMWNEDNLALLWWRGTYYTAQSYDAAIVGIIECTSDTVVQQTYVDADSTNTFLADGSPLTTTGPDSLRGPSDSLWHRRTTFGNGSFVLTSSENEGENCPLIKTQTIFNEAGTYDVWGNFWANPDEDWRIEAGLSPDSMQIFRQMACKQVREGDHNTPLILAGEGNTFLYQAFLGRVELEAGDTLEVFIDDEAIQTGTENTLVGGVCRSWYDGISYSHPGKPTGDISGITLYENKEATTEFELKQNYPNPFNSITTINYTLSRKSHVNLSVFNILGQKVITLVNQETNPGTYHLTWNAKNTPAGIYFLKIKVNNKSDTKKMLLLK